MKISVAGGHKKTYDLDGLIQNMDSYFIPIEDDDIFFFTKEMTDEYIAEAVEYCIREIVLANEKSMHKFLDMLREKHNFVEHYLLDIGVTGSEVQGLVNKLVK